MDLHRLVESLPDFAFYALEPTGEVRGWSDAATRLLGFTRDEVIGRPPAAFAARQPGAGAGEEAAAAIGVAARAGRAETFGWAFRKDGSRFWANEITAPIHDATGQTVGFSRVVRDVTSWKKAEEERDRIVTLSADLICVAGFDGFFKRINPSFTRVLGYAAEEILGRPYMDFVHPDDREATRREAGGFTSGEHDSMRSFLNRYRRSDGAYRWLEWRSVADPEERLVYAVARDVTEQKLADQKLLDYSKELERSNAELQQFAYVASHDLQEPLRAVAGCVQMLGERNAGRLDERSAELMGHAVDGAKRMQTLINDLLAFSRIGSKGISAASVDARVAVDKALRQLQVALQESDAAVSVDPLPHVWADVVQLAQVFQNLIGNAIKFRGASRPEIQVRAEQGADGETVFSVRDNGIGVAPEYHGRVFGLFQRLHSRRDYPGTGIGLAICKKIVERHGGRIWVESRAGEGANFRFALPVGPT